MTSTVSRFIDAVQELPGVNKRANADAEWSRHDDLERRKEDPIERIWRNTKTKIFRFDQPLSDPGNVLEIGAAPERT